MRDGKEKWEHRHPAGGVKPSQFFGPYSIGRYFKLFFVASLFLITPFSL